MVVLILDNEMSIEDMGISSKFIKFSGTITMLTNETEIPIVLGDIIDLKFYPLNSFYHELPIIWSNNEYQIIIPLDEFQYASKNLVKGHNIRDNSNVRVVSLGYNYIRREEYEFSLQSKLFPHLYLEKMRYVRSLFPISCFSISVPLGCEIGGNTILYQLLTFFNINFNREGYAIVMRLLANNEESQVYLYLDLLKQIIKKNQIKEEKPTVLFLEEPVIMHKEKKLTYYYILTAESFNKQMAKKEDEPLIITYIIKNSFGNFLLFLVFFVSIILMLVLLLIPFLKPNPNVFFNSNYYVSSIALLLSGSIFYHQLTQIGYDLVHRKWIYSLFIAFWFIVLLNLLIAALRTVRPASM